jgi:hypothetical protein
MYKLFGVLFFGLVTLTKLSACDACSCTSMNSLDGQLIPTNKSLFGFSTAYVHQLNAQNQRVNNLSNSLFGAFSFAKRWQILASLPIQQNFIRQKNEATETQYGLGDASLMVSYLALNRTSSEGAKHKMIPRIGFKFPTGYYNQDLSENANLGTKSFDFLLSFQYILEKNQQGLNAMFNTRINTTNPYEYRFGNKFDISSFYFVKRNTKKASYMPFVGLTAEWIQHDMHNNFERKLSGGEGLYGFAGLAWNWDNKAALFFKGDMPVYQNYDSSDGKVFTNIRAQIQFTYFINKKIKQS